MALFLQESLESNLNDNISIEEAYEGLIEASMDMQDLTESLLQADFIIHEQCKVLTEAEADTKKIGFLTKATEAIKKFIIAVRDKVVAFFKKIGSMLKNAWDKLSSTATSLFVPEGGVEAVNDVLVKAADLQKVSDSASISKSDIATKSLLLKKSVEKVKFVFNKKDDVPQKSKIVPIASVKGIFQLAIMTAAAGVATQQIFSKRAKTAEDNIKRLQEAERVAKAKSDAEKAAVKETKRKAANDKSVLEVLAQIQKDNEEARMASKTSTETASAIGLATTLLGGFKSTMQRKKKV